MILSLTNQESLVPRAPIGLLKRAMTLGQLLQNPAHLCPLFHVAENHLIRKMAPLLPHTEAPTVMVERSPSIGTKAHALSKMTDGQTTLQEVLRVTDGH